MNGSFQPTRWSMIRGAGSDDPSVRQAALERLCAQYWYPLYAYLRRRGRDPADAADLVQGLFANLLGGERLALVDEGGGRFRSWLLTALQNHERDVRDREQAQKRGGGRVPVSIDAEVGEQRFELYGDAGLDPRAAYERAWASETMRMARDLLDQELRASGKGRLFDALIGCLLDGDERARGEIAVELGLSPVAVRVALHRMRTRYRELLVTLVADSLGDRHAAGDELRELAVALGGGFSQASR